MHQSEFERDRAFLSRALTALTLQDLAGVDAADAAAGVIDGHDDHGIDGVLVDPTLPQLWIVQAKWSDNGRASLDQAAALKLHRGIGKLLDGDDFMLSLQRSYVVKRGEPDPEPDAGCSVVEAARALACAHPDPSYAARAKQDSSVLWETGTRGTYEILFGHPPSAYRIWRIVQLVRGVRERLQVEKDDRDGRAAQVAAQGDLLIAHLLFRQTRLEPLDDAQYDWESQLDGALSQVGTILDWLTHHVDAAYAGAFIPPTFRDPQRCTALAELVLGDLSSGRPVPELPSEYSATSISTRGRRTNAVIVLVDSGRIDDGTRLEFRPGTGTERGAIQPWLAVDPRRGEATWVNNRGAPLLWTADGRRYSPSGLAKHMLRQVGLNAKAVQGPSRWFVHGEGSLVELADQVREGDRS